MLEFAVGIFFGCIAGVAAMCMVVTAGREDERLELYEQMRNLENRKPIQFINEKKEPVFTVLDGGGIKLIAPDGETQISICHYLDKDHACIDGKEWELLQFAEEMEKRGIVLSPM